MRIRWRIVFSSLALLLVGFVVVVVVPYFNHAVYPDSLSRSALMGAVGYAVIPEDRQIDELGAPGHIRAEADARAYVEALVKRWDPNETNPHLDEFEERLAQAEYAAVRDPNKLIPESQVAKTFNRLMDEWEMPAWTRVAMPELHAFRISYVLTVYPRSVVRLPDKSIAPSCRPTEALFLLHMLDSRGGIPPEIREEVRASRFPWSILKRVSLHPANTPTPQNLQRDEYIGLRRKYFANHPTSFESEVSDIFSQLGIR
jgi:hypothetical protein